MKSNLLDKEDGFKAIHHLSENLTKLMKAAKLNDNDLGLAVGISVKTIQKLRLEKGSNPTFQTLTSLANYFGININQLVGLEPITEDEKGIFVPAHSNSLLVPVLELHEISNLKAIRQEIKPGESGREWVPATVSLSTDAFAIIAKGTQTSEKFPEGGVLIFDPNVEKKDRDYVIVLPNNNPTPVIRQYINDGTNEYFKGLNPEIKKVETYDNYKILGVMRQVQINLAAIAK